MWGGRFGAPPSELLRRLNDSFSFDRELFDEDIEGSIAWVQALLDAGAMTAEECDKLIAGLRRVPPPKHGDYEDVHSYVEARLYEEVGVLAGKLHTGRSRNDQVATDLRLWLKKACSEGHELARMVAHALAKRALEEAAAPMPGYTHSKQAEPVTFGHWCMAYVAMLQRDMSRFADAKKRGDECPLGSAALAGTPIKIDREKLAKSLGFAHATANSLDSVSDRDLGAEYLFAASMTLSHLSRMAEDLIFFTSDEAGYAELPDALATGSSRMPHKKNPDILELARGHAGRAVGELAGFLALLKGLPLAYDKDLQLDKEPLFRTRATLEILLPALASLVERLKLHHARMQEAATSPLLLATDAADELAAKGIPFREAHEIVGREGSKSHNTIEAILAKKGTIGGTSPDRVREAARKALETLE